jgi:hypothetical protein
MGALYPLQYALLERESIGMSLIEKPIKDDTAIFFAKGESRLDAVGISAIQTAVEAINNAAVESEILIEIQGTAPLCYNEVTRDIDSGFIGYSKYLSGKVDLGNPFLNEEFGYLYKGPIEFSTKKETKYMGRPIKLAYSRAANVVNQLIEGGVDESRIDARYNIAYAGGKSLSCDKSNPILNMVTISATYLSTTTQEKISLDLSPTP